MSRPARHCAGMLLACLAWACTPAASPLPAVRLPVDLGTAPAPYAQLEAQVHARVNAYRAAQGLPPLRLDPYLAQVARRHSEAMAQRRRPLGHEGMDQRTAEVQRQLAIRAIAENVAYDSRPNLIEQVVTGWIGSPGHRANIVGSYDLTGVGVARSDQGIFYFTQIFVAQR